MENVKRENHGDIKMSKTNSVNKKVVCSLLIALLATSLVLVTLMFDDSTLLANAKTVLDVEIKGLSKLGVNDPGQYVATVDGVADPTGSYVWTISPDDGKTTLTSTGYSCTVTFIEATLEPYLLSVTVSKAGAVGFDVFTLYDPVTLPDYHLSVASNPYNYMIAADGLGWYYVVNGTSGQVVTSGTNSTALEISTYAYGDGAVVLNQIAHNSSATVPTNVTVIELYQDDVEYYGSTYTFNGAVYGTSFNSTTFYVGATNVTGNMLTGGTTWQGTWNTTVAQIIGNAAITWGQITNANTTIQQLVALYESTAWLGAWNATVTDIIGDTAITWSQITNANTTVNALVTAYFVSANITAANFASTQPMGDYTYMIYVDPTNSSLYNAKHANGTICWTSTNASYVVNSAISSVGIGGKIIFGSGVFNLANTIQMTTGSIILEGQGKGFGDTQRGTYLNGTSATVDVFTISGGTFHVIRDMEIHGGKSGIYASSAADLLLYDLSITLNAQYGVRITGMKHLVIDSCWIEQCTYDGVYIYDPSFSNKGQFRIVNSHVTLCGYNGIKVVGNDTSRGSIISTSNIEFNGYSGILAQGVLDLKILGNTFINNSVSTAGTYADIILTDSGTFNCSKVEIGSNTFRDFYPTSFAPYCVHVKRTSTDLLIHHNDFGSYTTAPILVDASAPGSSIRWSDNNGFVTERSFSGTNTTATTAVLNHGLYSNATSVWVSFSSSAITGYTWSSTSTQVTITPTGTLPASWTCYVKAQYAP